MFPPRPAPLISTMDARSRKENGGFRQNQTFALTDLNDRLVATCRLPDSPHLGTQNWCLNGDKGSAAD